MERIVSKSNPLIKDVKKLLLSSKERAKSGLFVLEGARLCFDAAESECEIETVLITETAQNRYPEKAKALCGRARRSVIISDEVSERLSDTEQPQGIFCVCKKKDGGSVRGRAVIALDKVQDPSNIGAIIRSAEAFGIDTLITYSCCDIYNPKALRASMGGALRMNIVDTDDLEGMLGSLCADYRIFATVPDRSAKSIKTADFTKPSVCIIGNEANGVEENILGASDELITIPMSGRAESLNAAAACAVTMWEMLR